MATEFRECAGVAQFNTGTSKCILDPGKVKAIILAMHGYKLPKNVTAEALQAATDRLVFFRSRQLSNTLRLVERPTKVLQDMGLTRLHPTRRKMTYGRWRISIQV